MLCNSGKSGTRLAVRKLVLKPAQCKPKERLQCTIGLPTQDCSAPAASQPKTAVHHLAANPRLQCTSGQPTEGCSAPAASQHKTAVHQQPANTRLQCTIGLPTQDCSAPAASQQKAAVHQRPADLRLQCTSGQPTCFHFFTTGFATLVPCLHNSSMTAYLSKKNCE